MTDFQATHSFRECVVCTVMKRIIVEDYYETEDFRIYLCNECHEPYYSYSDEAGLDYKNRQIIHESDCQLCALRWIELYKRIHHWARMCVICLAKYRELTN